MKIKLRTLTPIHIGTGKKLLPLEYFNSYRINYDKLFDLVAEQKKDDFFRWLDENPDISVNEIQRIFGIKHQEIIQKASLYRLSGSFQRGVNEGIKDSANKFYVPGSSIKGALRTALMYKVLKNSSYKEFLLDIIATIIKEANTVKRDKRKINNLLKSADDELERVVFICGVQKEINGKIVTTFDDHNYDLLKLISISDSSSLETDTNGEITELQVYAFKKAQPHNNFRTHTESITAGSEIDVVILFDTAFLKRAHKELNKKDTDFGKKYFIGFERKLKYLFDIDIKNDTDFNEDKIRNNIVNAFTDYGSEVSKLESEWDSSISNKNNKYFSSLDKLYKIGNKFKIGFGTGFSGMTILPLLLADSNLKEKVFDFYKTVGIGFHRSNNTPLNIDEFPFTRKYSNKQSVYGAFGWVQIVKDGENEVTVTNNKDENKVERPPNTVIAEIVDDKLRPPKVKIIEGDHSGKETILPGVRLEGLGLANGSKVYVKLYLGKNTIEKAEFKETFDKIIR